MSQPVERESMEVDVLYHFDGQLVKTEPVEVETPITTTESPLLAGPEPAIVGILRAGLVMVEAILTLIPTGRVGHWLIRSTRSRTVIWT